MIRIIIRVIMPIVVIIVIIVTIWCIANFRSVEAQAGCRAEALAVGFGAVFSGLEFEQRAPQ